MLDIRLIEDAGRNACARYDVVEHVSRDGAARNQDGLLDIAVTREVVALDHHAFARHHEHGLDAETVTALSLEYGGDAQLFTEFEQIVSKRRWRNRQRHRDAGGLFGLVVEGMAGHQPDPVDRLAAVKGRLPGVLCTRRCRAHDRPAHDAERNELKGQGVEGHLQYLSRYPWRYL